MAKGELVCNGSSNFLKARFATGFNLTVNFDGASKSNNAAALYQRLVADVLNIAIKNCDGARIDGPISFQINIVLPNGSQKKFLKLFKELEHRSAELQIESFDVRINNLEQVFIK